MWRGRQCTKQRRLNNEIEQALVATFERNKVRVGGEPNHQCNTIENVSISPDEEYLVFLSPSHIVPVTFSFDAYNEGLFRGNEKYPVLNVLGNLQP